jgi:hypothetical protein
MYVGTCFVLDVSQATTTRSDTLFKYGGDAVLAQTLQAIMIMYSPHLSMFVNQCIISYDLVPKMILHSQFAYRCLVPFTIAVLLAAFVPRSSHDGQPASSASRAAVHVVSEASFSLASIVGSPEVHYGHYYECDRLHVLALCLALAHQLGILHYGAEIATLMRLGNNLCFIMDEF